MILIIFFFCSYKQDDKKKKKKKTTLRVFFIPVKIKNIDEPMHISRSFRRKESAGCSIISDFAYWGQGFHAWMPAFASLTCSGPVRKNELLHLLWCAKVRMYNSIHWTTCAPLISAWNYFTAAGYAFSHKKLYKCKTTWKWGCALTGAHE